MRCKASVSLAVEDPDDKILALVCGGSSNRSRVGCPLLSDALFLKVNLNVFLLLFASRGFGSRSIPAAFLLWGGSLRHIEEIEAVI